MFGVIQAEEEVTVNGEKVENASEEEESEEMESDEEERLPLAEGAAQRGACETPSRVRTEEEKDISAVAVSMCGHCVVF